MISHQEHAFLLFYDAVWGSSEVQIRERGCLPEMPRSGDLASRSGRHGRVEGHWAGEFRSWCLPFHTDIHPALFAVMLRHAGRHFRRFATGATARRLKP